MKEEQIEETKKEILENWKKRNGWLGIGRVKLESLSQEKRWKKRKVIALMRKKKIIFLEKRYYFVNEK